MIGGRAERGKIARQVRALVLGHPALDRETRDARLEVAAAAFGLAPAEIEPLLWADLATERPVVLPDGRPQAERLAALANLDRIQSAVRRAHAVRIEVSGDANQLVRTVARFGLVSTVSRTGPRTLRLDVTGPLALFHATTIYGRALAALVPILARHAEFALEIEGSLWGRDRTLRIAPPLLLAPDTRAPRSIGIAERLARDLEARGVVVERDPPPLEIGTAIVFSDLAVADARIEIVGFSTDAYLAHKLERYRAAGVSRLVLCVDAERSREIPPLPSIVRYRRRIDAAEVRARLEG